MRTEQVDIVVIGSGIAGLSYAIRCSEFAKVLIVTKSSVDASNTMFAQGGISAVFDDKDSLENHIADTLTAGDGICDRNAVEVLVSNAKEAVLYLEKLNVKFNKNEDGTFDLHREGGHSHARVVHNADATGREVETSLVKEVGNYKNIKIYEHHFAYDLVVNNNTCNGVLVFDEQAGEFVQIQAKITMLASGGLGQVFLRNTNPSVATGDGFAIAYRAGAAMMNMEFVQFHPTTLFSKKGETFLITEAIRGFKAILRNKAGEAFMEGVHPLKSLAPRDIVSQAIIKEMSGSGDECVFLDLTHLDQKEVAKHFPNIYERCVQEGLDLAKDMIPVVPAAHYMCGGIKTDLKAKTNIENLYACGECSGTGVHGANRLASNSLLEGLVFAEQAAIDTRQKLNNCNVSFETVSVSTKIAPISREDEEIDEMRNYVQELMWNDCGIIRSEKQLRFCLSELEILLEHAENNLNENGFSVKVIELINLIICAQLIASSALSRKESRGCHYRSDFSQKNSEAIPSLKVLHNIAS